jgi:hypothetical protein
LKQLQVGRRGSQPEDNGSAHAFSTRTFSVPMTGREGLRSQRTSPTFPAPPFSRHRCASKVQLRTEN